MCCSCRTWTARRCTSLAILLQVSPLTALWVLLQDPLEVEPELEVLALEVPVEGLVSTLAAPPPLEPAWLSAMSRYC